VSTIALLQSQGFLGMRKSPRKIPQGQWQKLSLVLCLTTVFFGLSFNKSSKSLAVLFSVGINKCQKELEKEQISKVTEPQFG